MSRLMKRLYSRNNEILEEIEKLICKDKLILVEGKKDKICLECLGFKHVFSLDRMPLYKVVEEVAKRTKDAVILTDLDKQGKKLYGYLNSALQDHGVRIDNRFRNFLFKKTPVRQIEGLESYLKKITDKAMLL
jgi:5S rRNA maturation endonuclease (ribonuclease M5)